MSAKAQSNPFTLDPSSDVPLGVQLNWRLRALILTGQLEPAERLPSLRRIAGWAGVNVNTVRSVYESLEGEGLIVSQQGRGTFVAEGVEPEPELETVALEALRQAQALGCEPRDLAVVVMASASMLGPEGEVTSPETAAAAEDSETIEVRQELRRQIARLEAELATYVRDLPELYTATPRAQAHVAGVEELEETRDTLIAKLSEAQKAAAERARAAGKARRGKGGGSGKGPLADAKDWWSR
ncbi:MAG: GntR family transcriptional regulator [Solirubrobacterales bacterium]